MSNLYISVSFCSPKTFYRQLVTLIQWINCYFRSLVSINIPLFLPDLQQLIFIIVHEDGWKLAKTVPPTMMGSALCACFSPASSLWALLNGRIPLSGAVVRTASCS